MSIFTTFGAFCKNSLHYNHFHNMSYSSDRLLLQLSEAATLRLIFPVLSIYFVIRILSNPGMLNFPCISDLTLLQCRQTFIKEWACALFAIFWYYFMAWKKSRISHFPLKIQEFLLLVWHNERDYTLIHQNRMLRTFTSDCMYWIKKIYETKRWKNFKGNWIVK